MILAKVSWVFSFAPFPLSSSVNQGLDGVTHAGLEVREEILSRWNILRFSTAWYDSARLPLLSVCFSTSSKWVGL